MIEQRTNEILQLYATVSAPPVEQASKQDQSSGAILGLINVLGAGPMTPMGQELYKLIHQI